MIPARGLGRRAKRGGGLVSATREEIEELKQQETTKIISKLTERELLLEEQMEKATAPISTIRSHVPSLVVSVPKIVRRPTGVGITKGWFFCRILAITIAFLCAAIISFTICNYLLFDRILAIITAFMCAAIISFTTHFSVGRLSAKRKGFPRKLICYRVVGR